MDDTEGVRSVDGTRYSDHYVRKVLRLLKAEPEAVFEGDRIDQLDDHLDAPDNPGT